ncbi:MAG: hypothetical protein ACKPHE_03750, partial [Microcystis panniformis]
PLKLAGSAIGKVMEGALLGVGTPLGEEVGTGIKDGIANKSSQIIGSFQLISREIASGLIQEIINKTEKITQEIGKIFIEDDEILGKMLAEIKDEILTKIKDVANTIAGKDNIKLESASMRQETAVKNRRRQSMAERQFSEEYIGLIGNVQGIRKSKDALSAQGNKLQEHAKQVAGQMRKYQEELGIRELEDSAKSTAERLRGITSQMLSNPESDITSLQQESDSLQMSLSDIVKRISEIRQQAVLRLKNETDLFNELDKLSEIELQLNTELDELPKKELQFNTELGSPELIDKVKKLSRARLDKSANKTAQPDKSADKTAQPDKSADKTAQPEAYKLIYNEVLKYSNIDPSQAVMPELKVKPNMPAMVLGLYNYKTNQVKVSQAVYDAIESGKMDIEQFSAIAHELRHAVQFDFGRIKADVEGPAIKLISPSSEQLSQFATNIEGSVAHAVTRSGSENEPRIRAIEADAYAFADNVKDSIALSVRKALSVSQFQSQFGIGGGKTTLAMGVAQRDALLKLKKIKTFVDEYGVDVSSEISATLENTEAISASIKPLISKAADIELLSPSDIANLSNNITEGYTKTVELINKEVESFKNNAIAKIKQSQTQSIYAPTKEEFKSTLQEQYTSTGLRQVAQKLGHVNVNKYKKKDLIELISQSGATQVDSVLTSFGDSIKKQSFKTGAPNILPVAQAKEVINELKAGTARVQALLKSFATSTDSERQGIIEQIVIEANKQTHQVDELFKKNQLPKGLGRQASGFRNYFEAIRQELVPEMIANNVSAVQKLYRQSGYRSEGLASFEDIKNEISRLINEIKQSVGAVDPEAQFYETFARIYKNLNRFNKAENVINQRYAAATGPTDPEVLFFEESLRILEI